MLKNKVKFLRKSEGFDMTQEQLAKELNVSRSTIAHMERDGDISGSLLLKTARFFGKDPREVFFTEDVV